MGRLFRLMRFSYYSTCDTRTDLLGVGPGGHDDDGGGGDGVSGVDSDGVYSGDAGGGCVAVMVVVMMIVLVVWW